MVRSNLEYSCQLWNPSNNKGQLYLIEGVQGRATNYIINNPRRPSPAHKDYKARLLQVNLLPLSYRREILDVIFLLRSLHGHTGYDARTFLKFTDEDNPRVTRQSTRGCDLQLKPMGRLLNNGFFPSRAARTWNALPFELKIRLRPLSSSLVIKQTINPYYYYLLENQFDPDDTCTWLNACFCPRCRPV